MWLSSGAASLPLSTVQHARNKLAHLSPHHKEAVQQSPLAYRCCICWMTPPMPCWQVPGEAQNTQGTPQHCAVQSQATVAPVVLLLIKKNRLSMLPCDMCALQPNNIALHNHNIHAQLGFWARTQHCAGRVGSFLVVANWKTSGHV